MFKSWGGNKFELPNYILVDSVPGVDLPVLLKLFRAAEVRGALPLVIIGAVLIAAMEYYYQSSQVPVPIIFSSTSSGIL